MALKARQVAEYFLSLSDPDVGDIISHLKLQKLLYYAQGFYLAIEGKRLFTENIYAWQHGPVVEELWYEYKKYGSAPIPVPDEIDFDIFTNDEQELLDEVYSVFGQYSAWRLKDMTHGEPPWQNTPRNCCISDAILIDYFSTQLIADE